VSAHIVQEIVVKMPTRVGLLADISAAIRQVGVNITAVSAYERDGEGKFLLVTTDNAKAVQALAAMGAQATEKTVVSADMPNRPGALEEAARKIADAGINIDYIYGTTNADSATLILKTDDDAKAAGLL
jgi:hypothetical protein